MSRFAASTALALAAWGLGCAETPPDPATNLRLPLDLEPIARLDEDDRPRADVFVADAEAQGVRVLQYRGLRTGFLRAPSVLQTTSVSAPGYPTDLSAAVDGTGERLFALAPGQSVLHALSVEPTSFEQNFDADRPRQVRAGTIVLAGPRDAFSDPLRRGSLVPPFVALRDAGFQLDLDDRAPVGLVVIDEARVERPPGLPLPRDPLTGDELDPPPASSVVDSRVLMSFTDAGGARSGSRLVVFDVRSATPGALRASTSTDASIPTADDIVDAWFPVDRFVRHAPISLQNDNGAIAIDVESSSAVFDVDVPIRHLERLADGTILATDTATNAVVRQLEISGLGTEPAIAQTASVALGGSAHRTVAFGSQGAVALRADRSALVALDCRAGDGPSAALGRCRRVSERFEALRSFDEDDEVLEVPPGVLLLREPSAVTGAFGARDEDGDPLVLSEVRSGVQYRVFPLDDVEADGGGIVSLVHEDSVASFVVGSIDDLRVATLENLVGTDDEGLVEPDPRVDEVFERRVVVRNDAIAGVSPDGFDVLDERTRIGGECLRPAEFLPELRTVYGERIENLADGEGSDDSSFLGCFPDDEVFDEDFVPRHVRNRFDFDETPPQQTSCDIEADPVTRDTIYRASYRGAVLRGGTDVVVDGDPAPRPEDAGCDGAVVELEVPASLDAFDVREGDRADVHFRCLVPEEADTTSFRDDRIELTAREGEVLAVSRRTMRVCVPEASTVVYAAPDGELPVAAPPLEPFAGIFAACQSAAIAETDEGIQERNLGPRRLEIFDFEVYPADPEVAVLSRESEGGEILGTLARCPVESGPDGGAQVRFDVSCRPDLPIRFTWVAPNGFSFRRVLDGPEPPAPPRDRREAGVEREVPADELGRSCTSSAECGRGRTCVGRSSDCPGQCEPLCTSNSCFALWSVRVVDTLELRVNGARSILVNLSASRDGTPGASVPRDSLYIPQQRGFLHSFPGARNLRQINLGRTDLDLDTFD